MYPLRNLGNLAALLIAFAGINGQLIADEPAARRSVTTQLGLSEGMLRGVPADLRRAATDPLLKFTRETTGNGVKLHHFSDPLALADQLNKGTIHFGIFQGHEFAWAQAKYPALMPLVIAEPECPLQAYCLVKWDCRAKQIGELTNGTLTLSPIQSSPCEMFLSREKKQHLKGDFAKQQTAATSTDGIFEVIEGKSICTVVDGTSLRYFQKVYPGAYKNLKILCQSEVFPSPCLAVNKHGFNDASADKLRKRLLGVRSQPNGVVFLDVWQMKGFVAASDDYSKALNRFREEFPAPTAQPITGGN